MLICISTGIKSKFDVERVARELVSLNLSCYLRFSDNRRNRTNKRRLKGLISLYESEMKVIDLE